MRARVVTLVVVGLVATGTAFVASPAGAQDATYVVRVDGKVPPGAFWQLNRFFPGEALQVHPGDVVNFAWRGGGAPHTATVIPDADPAVWRADNTGSGDPYEEVILDTAAGGDDDEPIFNPAMLTPAPVDCGSTQTPCSFGGNDVVNSGFLFGDPRNQPSFAVSVDAPVGDYAFLCLLHPGMEATLDVVAPGQTIPSPDEVRADAKAEHETAVTEDGPAAELMAQRVRRTNIGGGNQRVTLNAGGFVNQVSANIFRPSVRAQVGDQIRFNGMLEIHTATFPASSVEDLGLEVPQCEVTGPDDPAETPADCASPDAFQVAVDPRTLAPTESNALRRPRRFVNTGIFAAPGTATLVARRPGRYTYVCIVHGPLMSGTIRIV
jgi:plastocyanin